VDASLMPAAFLGHGNPMNTLAHNRYTEAWQAFGLTVPRPRAIVMVSAHWYVGARAVTAMTEPRTIHDFYGFPDELFAVEYPAPGAPDVAERVVEVVKPRWVGLDHDQWGLDHGTWSVLVHAFPEADVPVIQLSLEVGTSFDDHVALGAALAPLRAEGVLVMGSGNVVHNLRAIDFGLSGEGFDWAHRFDDAAREILTSDPSRIGSLVDHPDFHRAVPTPDHFLPILYLAGLAAAAGEPLEVLVDGYDAGSLSMTAYALGCGAVPHVTGDASEPAFPDPREVLPEDTNI
jgi:4,5-DOPA dioxygenase extradiol